MVLNGIALWKQEARNRDRVSKEKAPSFRDSWAAYAKTGRAARRLLAIGMGTVAFSMQDVLLEPYGGKVLHLPVGMTTSLTALLAIGGAAGLGLAAKSLNRGARSLSRGRLRRPRGSRGLHLRHFLRPHGLAAALRDGRGHGRLRRRPLRPTAP